MAESSSDHDVVLDVEGSGVQPPVDPKIRKQFALSIGENSVHGSDSLENAKIEIAQFFTDDQIVG